MGSKISKSLSRKKGSTPIARNGATLAQQDVAARTAIDEDEESEGSLPDAIRSAQEKRWAHFHGREEKKEFKNGEEVSESQIPLTEVLDVDDTDPTGSLDLDDTASAKEVHPEGEASPRSPKVRFQAAARVAGVAARMAKQKDEADEETLRDSAAAEDAPLNLPSYTRPGTADSRSTALSSVSSATYARRRLDEWERADDKNLWHVYRQCEEYKKNGYLQCFQAEKGRLRGIDYVLGAREVRVDDKVDDTGNKKGKTKLDVRRESVRPMEKVASLMKNIDLDDEAKVRRAEMLLRNAKFFMDMEEKAPGLIGDIAPNMKFFKEDAGQILIRQGESADRMYVLSHGEVAVFKLSSSKMKKLGSPRAEEFSSLLTLTESRWLGPKYRPKRLEEESPNSSASPSRRHSISSSQSRRGSFEAAPKDAPKSRMTIAAAATAADQQNDDAVRYRTTDGGGTFTHSSQVGNQIRKLGPGVVLGERALLNDTDRSATVKCSKDCEFAMLDFASYQKALTFRANKIAFFKRYVPGYRSLDGDSPAFSSFRVATFEKGHELLHEGAKPEERIYAIERGTVEFRRRESTKDAVAEIGSTPLNQSRAGTRRIGMEPTTCCYDVGKVGDVFCSLDTFPMNAHELFSVVVTSPDCVVWYTTHGGITHIPEDVLKTMRDHMMDCMVARLERLRERIPEAFVPPLLPSGIPTDAERRKQLARMNQRRRRNPVLSTFQLPPGHSHWEADPGWYPRMRGPPLKTVRAVSVLE